MYVCLYVSIYLSIYLSFYLSMYLSMYLCIYVCMYACMHVCMYACMGVWMYAYLMYVCHNSVCSWRQETAFDIAKRTLISKTNHPLGKATANLMAE